MPTVTCRLAQQLLVTSVTSPVNNLKTQLRHTLVPSPPHCRMVPLSSWSIQPPGHEFLMRNLSTVLTCTPLPLQQTHPWELNMRWIVPEESTTIQHPTANFAGFCQFAQPSKETRSNSISWNKSISARTIFYCQAPWEIRLLIKLFPLTIETCLGKSWHNLLQYQLVPENMTILCYKNQQVVKWDN